MYTWPISETHTLDQAIFEHDEGYLIWSLLKIGEAKVRKPLPYTQCSCAWACILRGLKDKMGESELPPEKIEDADEYKKIFNEEVIEVSKCTPEQILDRIHALETIVRQARTRIQAANFEVNERKKRMSKADREALEKKDKEYRVKPQEEKKERAAPVSKEDKAIHDVMKLLKMDYEAAKKWIEENG